MIETAQARTLTPERAQEILDKVDRWESTLTDPVALAEYLVKLLKGQRRDLELARMTIAGQDFILNDADALRGVIRDLEAGKAWRSGL